MNLLSAFLKLLVVVCWYGVCACMLIFCVPCLSSVTLDPTVDEFEGEEYFEDFEENQGQATQGKPPLLVAYLDPSFIYASPSIYVLSKMHYFFVIAITS
jgi:hypothetical protein